MSAERLLHDLGGAEVALDTVAFIYLIEEHPQYLPLLEPLFSRVEGRRLRIATSAITLLEVLVIPYRVGDLGLADRYRELLTCSSGLRLVPLDNAQLSAAAQLRALYRVRTPDALQLTAALSTDSRVLLTNDRRLPRIPGLRILELQAYLEGPAV